MTRTLSRRSILSALGVALPWGLGAAAKASGGGGPAVPAPVLRFRPVEDAVRAAFADRGRTGLDDAHGLPCRRVEVGHSELTQAGVQGCHNDRPFAGFPAGHLRLVRVGSEPGPLRDGVRLYVSTIDVVLTGGLPPGVPSRPLDFSSLPPAPTFA